MTLPDKFIEQDDPKKMYDKAGLNSSQISKKISDILFQRFTCPQRRSQLRALQIYFIQLTFITYNESELSKFFLNIL